MLNRWPGPARPCSRWGAISRVADVLADPSSIQAIVLRIYNQYWYISFNYGQRLALLH